MHKADTKHHDSMLQKKLENIYKLRRMRSKINWDRAQYITLLEAFGNPQRNVPPVIHVAGTNGKGSITAILRAILEAQGLKVHCYTSPHLIHVNERIVLAGTQIDDAYLETLIDQALELNKDAPLAFFEITTALAFKAFADTPADILLLEVGMGGRLDCTNVIDKPLATIISRISMDHVSSLGETIQDIAAEKAGIMKPDIPCITGHQGNNPDAEAVTNVLKNAAKKYSARIHVNNADWYVEQENDHMIFSFHGEKHRFPLPSLQGAHQVQNAGAALAALCSIKNKFDISHNAIETGLKSVQWPGRLQKIRTAPFNITDETEIWLDCGHNDSAGEALAAQIQSWEKQDKRPTYIVMGMLGKKDSGKFLTPLLLQISSLHIVPIATDSPVYSKDDITENLDHLPHNIQIYAHDHFVTAIHTISQKESFSRILIVGSVYLAGSVLKYIQDSD